MSSSNQKRQDPISEFMFGRRHTDKQSVNGTEESQKITDLATNIDLNKLMNHVDSFKTVYDQFKPAIKQLTPLVDFFKKKK